MSRPSLRASWLDVLNGALLVVAVALAAWSLCLGRASPPGRLLLPLLGAGDSPMALQRPGGGHDTARLKAAALGDYVTVEDLVRGALALQKGSASGVPALEPSERARVQEILQRAAEHRDALFQAEEALLAAERDLNESARALADALGPAQREWIRAQRNAVSVGERERAYWRELDELLGARP
jgi:hypothetical protein